MSLLEKYQRIKNTFSYSIQSSSGEERGDNSGDGIGNFQIKIPNVPFPENQKSQLGIFTLESFYFTKQTDTQYISSGDNSLPANSDYEISGFYVEINGLGLRPQIFTTALNDRLRSNKIFPIMNEYGKRRENDTDVFDNNRVLSGGKSDKSVICSNPCGTTLQVKVISMDDGEIIQDQTEINSIINFKIELLPDEFQEREIE